MNQREGKFKSQVAEWRGVNQRVSLNLIQNDQILATMGVAVNSTATLGRYEGKRLVEAFESRVTTIHEVGENLIFQLRDRVYAMLKSDFLQALQDAEAQSETLTYVSEGDTNGVFYFLGTKKGAEAWQNPTLNGSLQISGDADATGTKPLLVNRTSDVWKSISKEAPYVVFDLGSSHALLPTTLTVRASSSPSENPEHLALEGSHDGIEWEGIYQIAHLTWTSNEWKVFAITANDSYRYLRLIHSVAGLNYAGVEQGIDSYVGDGFEGYALGSIAELNLTEFNTIEGATLSDSVTTNL